MKSTVSYVALWLAAVGLALALALASPTESSVMGRIPSFMSQTLAQQPMTVPEGLPSNRTLALIAFKRSQHAQVESWIEGLNLRNDSSIAWMRMPVLNDPGTPQGRNAVKDKLLGHYPAEDERARLLPAFVNRELFIRSAGLNSTEQVYAVVLNRQGDVVARVAGKFDPDKAETLRETLRAQGS